MEEIINVSERHLIDVLLRCLRQTSFKDVFKKDFLNFQKKNYFYLLIFAFLSKCCVHVFGHKAVTTLSLQRRCSDQNLTLLHRCVFDVGF